MLAIWLQGVGEEGGGCKTSFANLIASVWGKKKKEKEKKKVLVNMLFVVLYPCGEVVGLRGVLASPCFALSLWGLGGCCLLNMAAAAVHWVRKTKNLGPYARLVCNDLINRQASERCYNVVVLKCYL